MTLLLNNYNIQTLFLSGESTKTKEVEKEIAEITGQIAFKVIITDSLI